MSPTLRVALWQCNPLPLDVAGNLQRLDRQAAIARAQGADLLVCPEMFLSGYDIGVDVSVPAANLWRVRVEVSWTDDTSGDTHMVPLEMLRTSKEAL